MIRIVAHHATTERDVEVDLDPGRAHVRDLAVALGDAATTDLLIGNRPVPGGTRVRDAGLRDGTSVRPVAPADAAPGLGTDLLDPVAHPDAVIELHAVGGQIAGSRQALAPGTYVIGRERSADVVFDHPTVSAAHLRLTVAIDGTCTIEDLGARNGTRVNGAHVLRPRGVQPDQLLELGAVQLRLRATRRATTAPAIPPAGATAVAFNRPPRPAADAGPDAVAVPDAPAAEPAVATFGWAALLAPVVVGAGMAVLFEPRMALFMLLSPVLLLANTFEDRRRSRRGAAAGRAAHDRRVQRYRHELAEAAAQLRLARDRALLDPAEAATRALTGDTRLWERRGDARDLLHLRVGLGTADLELPLSYPTEPSEDLLELAHAARRGPGTPVGVALSGGRNLGIVGDRRSALPLLRWLVVAAAVAHGPADLRIAIVTDRPGAWSWAAWLPHTASATVPSARLLGGDAAAWPTVLADVAASASADDGPRTLLVVDVPGLTHGRGATARELLRIGGRVSGLVAAEAASQLPDACTDVVTLQGEDGRATLVDPGSGTGVDDLLVAGITVPLARRVARALAGLDDPEASDVSGGLPADVALLDLLGFAEPSAEAVRERWRRAGTTVATPVGIDTDAAFVIDLVRDGPHGLLGGTTGSGKSELLRSLVAGLAASSDPEHLNLVLIDYKGGSAFDVCADLPHTVGLVTDLDGHLAARALTCLEAELAWRERRLRAAGAAGLPAYLAGEADEPLPRLLVVIDEFAALAAELPDFVDALVDIAQRGRSLGVHLLLATQRPSGVISEPIRANTDLRLALRVQDEHDSRDVLGAADAAAIARSRPGRGYVRRGTTAPTRFQAARVTGCSTGDQPRPEVVVTSIVFAPTRPDAAPPERAGPSDLARLVRACRDAATGFAPPRQPWPPPLPTALSHDAVADTAAPAGTAVVGLADHPQQQRQAPLTVDLGSGSVALVGTAGSGPSETLAAIALDLAARHHVDDLHLYILDFGTAGLAPLAGLPHVGGYVGAAERDRQLRLLRTLRDELDARRARASDGADPPRLVLLLDNYAAFAAAFDDVATYPLRGSLERLVADGPSVGITTVLTADRPGAVPATVAAALARTLVFRLADTFDWAGYGVSPDRIPPTVTGRALDTATGCELQVAVPDGPDLDASVDAIVDADAEDAPAVRRRPVPIGVLPTQAKLAELPDVGTLGPGGGWDLPLGIADDDLGPARLVLGAGDHALVAGPARAGRTTALRVIGEAVARADAAVTITFLAPRACDTATIAGARIVTDPATVPELAAELANATGPQLVLVDDAELIDDADGSLARLLATRRPDLRVVAAGRIDALRRTSRPWLTEVRRTRTGLALKPNPDTDGLLWETALPRRGPEAWPVGRGYLLHEGRAALIQVALP
jgi:S-DNA-T family DNA segregation ATPase FtsK/SpoIIIE